MFKIKNDREERTYTRTYTYYAYPPKSKYLLVKNLIASGLGMILIDIYSVYIMIFCAKHDSLVLDCMVFFGFLVVNFGVFTNIWSEWKNGRNYK